MSTAQHTPQRRILKPGSGTLAALRHVCPHCYAAQGVRCTLPTGEPLVHAHSKRMDLARANKTTGSTT